MDNKRDKTEVKAGVTDIKKRASFQLFKKGRAGRHQKVTGHRALQKRPRHNTDMLAVYPALFNKSVVKELCYKTMGIIITSIISEQH